MSIELADATPETNNLARRESTQSDITPTPGVDVLDGNRSPSEEALRPSDANISVVEDVSLSIDTSDVINAPNLSLWRIFVLFLSFGIRAFGGPVAQINIFKDELVVQGKWISMSRFKRAYAAYQVLPGPEATELAVYFGILAGGPIGGFLGGLGFISPGVALMLLFSWFYYTYGLTNKLFIAVFHGLQPAVCAMVVRAAHKIADSTCRHHDGSGSLDQHLLLIVGLGAFESILSVNFFITKAHGIAIYLLLRRGWYVAAGVVTVSVLAVFIAIIAAIGPMGDLVPQGFGIASRYGNTLGSQFLVGLVGGTVTFGGAYTSIPFIQVCKEHVFFLLFVRSPDLTPILTYSTKLLRLENGLPTSSF